MSNLFIKEKQSDSHEFTGVVDVKASMDRMWRSTELKNVEGWVM